MANEPEFKRTKRGGYFVYFGDRLAGNVRKHEAWTVRGNRVFWEASAKGRVVGRAETRVSAAKLLSA